MHQILKHCAVQIELPIKRAGVRHASKAPSCESDANCSCRNLKPAVINITGMMRLIAVDIAAQSVSQRDASQPKTALHCEDTQCSILELLCAAHIFVNSKTGSGPMGSRCLCGLTTTEIAFATGSNLGQPCRVTRQDANK